MSTLTVFKRWIFQSMSADTVTTTADATTTADDTITADATSTADATASAANKTLIFKRKLEVGSRNC